MTHRMIPVIEALQAGSCPSSALSSIPLLTLTTEDSSHPAFSKPHHRGPRNARTVPIWWIVTRPISLNPRIRHRTADQATPTSHQGLAHISHLDGNQETLATSTLHRASYGPALQHPSQRLVPDQARIHGIEGTSMEAMPPCLGDKRARPDHVRPPSRP